MASSNGAARVAAINQQIATTGGVAPSAQNQNTQAGPAQVSKAVTQALNPHDAVGYNPATDPTSSAYNPNATAQPSPTTANATPTTGAVQTTAQTQPTNNQAQNQGVPSGIPGQPNLTGSQTDQATQAIDQLKQKYGKALSDITGTGVQAPSGQGAANAGVNAALNNQPVQQPTTTPAVDNFMNPATNPNLDVATQQLREFLSPASDRQALTDAMTQLRTDRGELAGLKTDLMNVKNIMAGSQQDIADEVTKAGGTISQSLLANMTISRNRALIARGQQLQDQIQSVTDLVATDTQLVGDMKQMAATQFSQNMSILQFQQTNYNNQLNATKSAYTTLMDSNPQGLLSSLQADPVQAQRFSQVMGVDMNTLQGMASTKQLDTQLKQLDIQTKQQSLASASASDAAVNPDVLQGMLNVYKSTGVLPAFGMSAKSPLRAQFYAALGADNGIVTEANTNKSVRAGLTQAYRTQQNLYSANQTAIQTLDKQLTLAQQYSDEVSRPGSPLLAKYALSVKQGVFGDPKTAALNNIVKTASYEFAKILSGAAASISGVTVNSQADAEALLNSAMSKGQFNEVVGLMRKEATFRLNAQKDTMTQLQSDMNNVGSLTDSLKQSANTASGGIDLNSTTFNGLTATGSWGSLTFPSQSALEAFKKDHQ